MLMNIFVSLAQICGPLILRIPLQDTDRSGTIGFAGKSDTLFEKFYTQVTESVRVCWLVEICCGLAERL